MLKRIRLRARKLMREWARKLVSWLPREQRFKVFRSFADCNPAPSSRLVLKIAETQEELEACFSLLHDAYVDSGFMKPDPSGMRVTIYHALPTTTTLCAKYDDKVVGTLSLIRESALGFPMQRVFDLGSVREQEGYIAEVSALAVHHDFRRTSGSILFPMMKFMYEYCTTFFDTRHLVIAVNPRHIEMYESLLLFRRLPATVVEHYDFVNGAPAIGATLDLKEAPAMFRKHYASKPARRNLYAYFVDVRLPNIQFPNRRFFTTNDPVLTPALLDHFFNVRTHGFQKLTERKKALLYSIYDLPAYRAVLPIPFAKDGPAPSISEHEHSRVRSHLRFSVKCPGQIVCPPTKGPAENIAIRVTEVSLLGFQAVAHKPLPVNTRCEAIITLGHADVSRISVFIVREKRSEARGLYGFQIDQPDLAWRKFVSALCGGVVYSDLDNATRFLESRFAHGSTKVSRDSARKPSEQSPPGASLDANPIDQSDGATPARQMADQKP